MGTAPCRAIECTLRKFPIVALERCLFFSVTSLLWQCSGLHALCQNSSRGCKPCHSERLNTLIQLKKWMWKTFLVQHLVPTFQMVPILRFEFLFFRCKFNVPMPPAPHLLLLQSTCKLFSHLCKLLPVPLQPTQMSWWVGLAEKERLRARGSTDTKKKYNKRQTCTY